METAITIISAFIIFMRKYTFILTFDYRLIANTCVSLYAFLSSLLATVFCCLHQPHKRRVPCTHDRSSTAPEYESIWIMQLDIQLLSQVLAPVTSMTSRNALLQHGKWKLVLSITVSLGLCLPIRCLYEKRHPDCFR
jgi:hypothetical protein